MPRRISPHQHRRLLCPAPPPSGSQLCPLSGALQAHRTDYEPFVEDDESFDAYCRRMRREATWAGNMEVQALSVLKQVNVCIHQIGQPLWLIPNFPDRTVRTLAAALRAPVSCDALSPRPASVC